MAETSLFEQDETHSRAHMAGIKARDDNLGMLEVKLTDLPPFSSDCTGITYHVIQSILRLVSCQGRKRALTNVMPYAPFPPRRVWVGHPNAEEMKTNLPPSTRCGFMAWNKRKGPRVCKSALKVLFRKTRRKVLTLTSYDRSSMATAVFKMSRLERDCRTRNDHVELGSSSQKFVGDLSSAAVLNSSCRGRQKGMSDGHLQSWLR